MNMDRSYLVTNNVESKASEKLMHTMFNAQRGGTILRSKSYILKHELSNILVILSERYYKKGITTCLTSLV
jgi:hypothetical protein